MNREKPERLSRDSIEARSGANHRECAQRTGAVVARIERSVEKTFRNLERYPFLEPDDRRQFLRYRLMFLESLRQIDRKIAEGLLTPLDLRGFPERNPFPSGTVRAGLFIGSFDPFQMTHLATALRFLASPECGADILFVVPEGAENPQKPNLSEYGYRMELIRRQLRRTFTPLIVPLDIGAGRNTVGIIEEFIGRFPGSRMSVTHLLGSDVLVWAHTLFREDLTIWNRAACRAAVEFSYRLFVIKRCPEEMFLGIVSRLRNEGIPVSVELEPLGTPSSTDFRDRHALTIIFPTDEIMKHMEFAFRYRMQRDWPGWPASE